MRSPARRARTLAALLVALAACSSAQAADGPVAEPVVVDLPGSATLAAAAADRAASACDPGADGLEPTPKAYRQETWAEVAELVGRAPLPSSAGDDPAAARALALDEVRAGWRGEPALGDDAWDHTETADVTCADGFLYVVQVLARAAEPADAGAYRRPRLAADDVEHREGLVYRTADDVDGRPVDLVLDLFLPPASADDGAAGRPTLVLVHGGGFAAGSRTWHTDDALAYARRGFVVATIDYRVDPDAGDSVTSHRAAAFAALDDAMEAVRWLRARADSLGIDRHRIAALGASAGGEIALGLALLEDLSPTGPYAGVSPKVDAAFSTGAYLTPANLTDPTRRSGGRPVPPGAAKLDETDSPVLLHHFGTDTESGRPWTYAAATCAAVRAAGDTCDLAISKGRDHIVGLGPTSTEIDRILAFLAVHLRLDG